jgi:hypothetical protein
MFGAPLKAKQGEKKKKKKKKKNAAVYFTSKPRH